MEFNFSPIDLATLQEEDIPNIPLKTLTLFTRRTVRARDCLRTHWTTITRNSPHLAQRIKDIFFETKVSEAMDIIEQHPMNIRCPKYYMEQLVRAVLIATSYTDKFSDPFSLVPQF